MNFIVFRSIADRIGEAKASGNLGNTFKMMGRHDEAIICCKKHLDISKELSDKVIKLIFKLLNNFSLILKLLNNFSLVFKVGEGRALYNLGNVYHTKGKSIARLGQQDPGEFPEEVKTCFEQAVGYYK